jgi:hypothetical protein
MRHAKIPALLGATLLSGCFTLLTSTDDLPGPAADAGGRDGAFWRADVDTDTLVDSAPDPKLVAHWAFDEGTGRLARDSSGNGHHGDLSNGATWTLGIRGNALAFERDAGGNVVAEVPGFGLSGLTVAGWVKSADTASTQTRLFGFGWEEGYFFLNFNMGFPFVECQTPYSYWGTGTAAMTSIADDTWHHVALVLDRSWPVMSLYIDGVEVARGGTSLKDAGPDVSEASDGFGQPDASYLFSIGSQSATFAIAFGGVMDDVWLFARSLDASEIAVLAARP